MNLKVFYDKYNEVKSFRSDRLVFSCVVGVRSKKVLDIVIFLGFSRCVDEG